MNQAYWFHLPVTGGTLTQQIRDFYGNLITFQPEVWAKEATTLHKDPGQDDKLHTWKQKLQQVYDNGQSLQNLHTWIHELSQRLYLSPVYTMHGHQTR